MKTILSLFLCLCMISPTLTISSGDDLSGIHTFSVEGTFDYDEAYAVLDGLNALRTGLGLSALTMDESLVDTAMQRAVELSIYYDHSRPNGESCFSAFPQGYMAAAENIAIGYLDAATVMEGWTDSPGHYANMVNPDLDAVGIGCFYQEGTMHWVQVFTGGADVTPDGRSGRERSTREVTALDEFLTLEVSPASAQLQVGETETFSLWSTVNAGWEHADRTKIVPNYAETENDNVARVDESGRVTGVGGGTTKLTLGLGGEAYAQADLLVLPADPDEVLGQYTDIDLTDWYVDAVSFVVERGLMEGTSETEFAPGATMTRAMFITVLGRYAEELGIEVDGYGYTFTDVEEDTWYTDYVGWAHANELVEGYDAETFGTGDDVTREQMAVIFVRFAEYAGIDLDTETSVSFTDSGDISDWAEDGVRKAASAGLITGHEDGRFEPRGSATRAQVAQVFMNFIG